MTGCNVPLNYQDLATFVDTEPSNYANNRTVIAQVLVPVIFLQTTGFDHGNFQDGVTADAICYPDPDNAFLNSNANRIEGMYVIMQLFGSSIEESWYKIEEVNVNRDHLLGNNIDNIELLLKKTRPIAGVS